MKYNFDEIIDRRNTDSVKWDRIPGNPEAIPMCVADMDFRCPKPVIDRVLEKAAFGIYAYTAVPPAFREATAAWQSRRHHWDIGQAEVIPISSVVPALYTAVAAFTEPGDRVILQRPVYGPFTGAVEQQGREVSNNALLLQDGRYQVNWEDLERRAADPKAKLMLLCSPHNPVGKVFTREELVRIGEICSRHQVILFADEIHGDFVYAGSRHIPAASVIPGCLTAVAPSKTFNLAAMKAAAVIAPDAGLAERFRRVLAVNHGDNLNMLGMYAYLAAYEAGDDYLDQLLSYLSAQVAHLQRRLEAEMPQIRLIVPQGTYLMWLDCRAMGMEPKALSDFFTWKAGVAMNAGDWFGQEGAGFMRMNLACPRQTLDRALDRIAEALAKEKSLDFREGTCKS